MSSSSEEDNNVNGIEAVCSSTASLQVRYDSPALVSSSSTSTANTLSDQFDDAPEEDDVVAERESTTQSPRSAAPATITTKTPVEKPKIVTSASLNPLDALAIACATAHTKGVQSQKSKQSSQQLATRAHRNKSTSATATKGRQIAPKTSKSTKSVSASPSKQDLILASNSISSHDVLCGRGGLTNHHPGNVFFRRLVRLQQESYLRASKREKAGVAKDIVERVRKVRGKFLKKDNKNPGMWIDIGDKKAREKTSQALREGAPELREELVAAASSNTGPTPVQQSQQQQHQLLQPRPPTATQNNTAAAPYGNRVRVVSADNGIAGLRPLFHAIQQSHHAQAPHLVLSGEQQQQHRHHQVAAAAAALTQNPHYQALAYAYVQSKTNPASQPLTSVPSSSASLLLPSPGSKRPLEEDAGVSSSDDGEGPKRGPRLKLLKSRLQRQQST